MDGVLLMRHRDEADAGRLEDVERVHIGRPDDAEDVLHAMRRQGFDESLARGHQGHGFLLKIVLQLPAVEMTS